MGKMKKKNMVNKNEFFDMLCTPGTADILRVSEKAGALTRLFPEISVMKNSAKRFYFHPDGLWQHAVETMEHLEHIAVSLKKIFPDNHAAIALHLSEPAGDCLSRLSLLKLTALFHDAAKPLCARKSGKKMRFIGHEQEGARIMGRIAKRLGLSKGVIDQACLLVEQHMRPISLTQATALTPRATTRFFTALGTATPDLLLLALADWHSYKRLKTHNKGQLKKQEIVLRELLRRFYSVPAVSSRKKIIDGSLVMKHFKLPSGPLIGAVLGLVAKAQDSGKVSTTQEALALIKSRLTLLKKRYKIK